MEPPALRIGFRYTTQCILCLIGFPSVGPGSSEEMMVRISLINSLQCLWVVRLLEVVLLPHNYQQ
jgi:hypothetical protein